MDIDKLDPFTRAYMECALWSSNDDDTPFDENHDITDIAPETQQAMITDCSSFQARYAVTLQACYESDVFIQGERYSATNAGHDFWLTRNGHGAGFWNKGLGDSGEELKNACGWKTDYPEIDLYIGDDGKIHA